MLGWLRGSAKKKGKDRRSLEDVEIAAKEFNLKRRETELRMIEDLAVSDEPDDREMALAMLSGRARDAVVAKHKQRRNDPLQQLTQQLLADKLTRDPMDDVLKMAELGKALRGMNGIGGETEGALASVLNSSAFAELGRGLGEALPGIVAGSRSGPRHPEALPARAQVDAAPAEAAPPADDDGSITPAAVLELLAAGDMSAAAVQLTAWAAEDDNPEVAGIVRGLVEVSDRRLLLQLGYYAQTAKDEWADVARWLIDHPDARRELIAAVRAIYFPPEDEAAGEGA